MDNVVIQFWFNAHNWYACCVQRKDICTINCSSQLLLNTLSYFVLPNPLPGKVSSMIFSQIHLWLCIYFARLEKSITTGKALCFKRASPLKSRPHSVPFQSRAGLSTLESEIPPKLFVITVNQQVHLKLTSNVVIINKHEDSVNIISDMLSWGGGWLVENIWIDSAAKERWAIESLSKAFCAKNLGG